MKRFLLPAVLLLAFLLRVIGLNKYPVGFTPDEASFGYDAYSILRTGKDQWGHSFPLVLKSFGDYKSPLYAYLTIPSVAVFGLSKFAVRLPNALFGVLAVYAVYLLSGRLFKNKKIAILSALLLAVSPWHIALSRGAFEANLTTFFLPFGAYLFLDKKYFWSGVMLGLNLFTYHSAKIVTPLVFLGLILYSKENLKKALPGIISFGALLILTLYTFTLGAGARVSERSITNGALEAGAKEKIDLIQKGTNPIIARIFHNKYQVIGERFINNYLQYFSLRFLILDGPAETTYGMVKGLGVLTYAEILGAISLAVFYRKVKNKELIWFLLSWLLIAPIPASLATGVGYAGNRTATMLPVVQLIVAWGLYNLTEKYRKSLYIIIPLIFLGLGVFLYKYVLLSPTESARGMLSGNLETVENLVSTSENYNNVVVPKSLSEPQIYVAFAAKYDPVKFQEATKKWNFEDIGVSWVDQIPEYSLGKFTFK